ncbi:hypothetical protein G5714_019087 [Onychostoma macrolepis]|uniref:MHC class I antigen n=1 Tax=Onychostoma macrolepis TaxID=369639 RepID=A0A7J6C1F8_9TELE|nr:hypothetical protein G5714_019087 [Onychostoma macrolepis]
MVLFIFLLSYTFLSDARQDKHFIRYKFAAFCKANTHPVFKAVCVCDDRQIAQYSNEERVWKRSSRTEDDWINAPEEPESRDWFLHQLNTLSNCTDSQCSELHVLQRTIGCELEKRPDGSEKSLRVFDEYGFDGEDFIAFNSDTLQWIDKNPKAKETKREWDQQTERNQFLQHYLKNCINWISTFNNTKMTPPDVHVFVPKVSDDHSKLVLSCLATGFYPRDIEMNITLDGTVLGNQISSGIRPNTDGSFQMRTSVEIDVNHKGFAVETPRSGSRPLSAQLTPPPLTFSVRSSRVFRIPCRHLALSKRANYSGVVVNAVPLLSPLMVTASAFHAWAPPTLKLHSPRHHVLIARIWVSPLCDLISFGGSESDAMDDSLSLVASDAEELLGSSHNSPPAVCRAQRSQHRHGC